MMNCFHISLVFLLYINLSFSQCIPNVFPPLAICKNKIVYLDAIGNASITAIDVDGGSSNNCSVFSLSVSQSLFNCADLGANSVTLTVTDSVISEEVDQQNLTASSVAGWDVVAQSFTAGVTGIMTKIELKTAYTSNQFSTLTIHSGSGNDGPILSTQTIDMLQSGGNNVVNNLITLATPVNVVAGQVYSFALSDNFGQITGLNTGGNPYPSGQILNGGTNANSPFDTWDMYFVTHVESLSLNSASCVATVTVLDTLLTEINSTNLTDLIGCYGEQITPDIPTLMDNCAGLISGNPGISFPINVPGLTVVNWVYNDGNGNTITQTQNVIIEAVDIGVTQTTGALTANLSGALYQWLDCDNGNTLMIGKINQVYIPSESGNYAVEITSNGCVDTSECLLFNFLGIEEFNQKKELIKIIDFMGRETRFTPNTHLIYIYSDGTRESIFKIIE